MDKSRRKRAIGRFAILGLMVLIPLAFLLFFSKGEQKFEPPGYLGPKSPVVVDGKETGDSTYYKVPDFSFTLLNGETADLDQYEDKIIVAIVIGTDCPKECEIQPESLLKILNKEIGGNSSYDDLVILAEFVDYDQSRIPTKEELNEYFTQNLDLDQWVFFTTPKNKLFDFKPYNGDKNLLSSNYPGARNGYAYYNFGLLIDKQRHVRGWYYLNDSRQARRLLDGIKLLKKEEDYANNK